MRAVWDYVVEPKGERYNNIKKIGDKELILNAEISHHQFVNREAIVKATPLGFDSIIEKGDVVIVHHNVFRRWYNQHKLEKNSSSFVKENTYIVSPDQIFAYTKNRDCEKCWRPMPGYCFIQPLKEDNKLNPMEKEKLMGVVKFSDGTVEQGALVGFKSYGQYEFVVDGKRLYRVKSNFITLKYEYQGNEKEYNPSWANSS